MARQIRDYRLGSPEARSKLPRAHNPYWREIVTGLHIGYRKGKRGGVWYGRKYLDEGKYEKWTLGLADDVVESDGVEVLSFAEADSKARLGPSGTKRGKMNTVNDVIDYYMKYQEAESRSPKTTQYVIDKHIKPTIGKKRLAKLTIDSIKDWRNELAKPKAVTKKKKKAVAHSARELRRRSQATANRVLTILKAALNYAERTGVYKGPSPWKLVSPFKHVDATEHPYLTQDEAIRLLNAAAPDLRLLVRGALETGCRYGELTSMKASDFNSDASTVTVRESKSGKVRHVHLTDSGQEFFDELTSDKKRSELMFLRADGEPWRKSQQHRPMREACKNAKINPPIPFKALRTTYGSLLARAGTPLQVIAAALGHSDSRITERHYAHLQPDHVADAIRANLPTFATTKSKVKRLKRK
jgi:integrase